MSLIQSAAALRKGQIARWIVPAAVYPFRSTTPGCKTSGFWARQIHSSQVRHSPFVVNRKPPKWQKPRDGLLFTQDDVPPLKWWETVLRAYNAGGPTPQDCLHTATQYCAIAIGSLSTWKGKLERDYGIDNYTLHCTAVILTQSTELKFGILGWHMLKTASDLNYDPSTVAMLHILTTIKDRGPEAQKQLESLLPRFEKIVRSGSNPDALTVQGIKLRARSKPKEALACFDRAIRAAATKQQPIGTPLTNWIDATASPSADRAPRWFMETECYMERASILLEMGREEEAAESLRVAALELDIPQGYMGLSLLMPKGSQEREDYLLRAAVSGVSRAYPHMAELETKKAEALDPGDPRRQDHQILAAEWSLLAKSD